MQLIEAGPSRTGEGWRMYRLLTRVEVSSPVVQPRAMWERFEVRARTGPFRREVVVLGLGRGGARWVELVGDVELLAGEYTIRQAGSPDRAWGVRIPQPGTPPVILCADGASTPSEHCARYLRDVAGRTLAAVQWRRVQRCCAGRLSAAPRLTRQNEDLLSIYRPVSGSLRVLVNRRPRLVKAGEYLVVNPAQVSYLSQEQAWPVEYERVLVGGEVLERAVEAVAGSLPADGLTFATDPQSFRETVEEAFRLASRWLRTPDPVGEPAQARIAAKMLVMALWASHPHGHVAAAPMRDRRLEAVLAYCNAHMAEALTVARLARECEMSEEWLRRTFRSELGCSPRAYIQGLRVRRAAELLADPQRTVKEAAASVGYPNVRPFYRIFRIHARTTPAAFRWREAERG